MGKPETSTVLGFTFICGKSKRGGFVLQPKARRNRMRATLQEVKAELRRRMHDTIPEQGRWLRAVVTGFNAYHAVPTNKRSIAAFRYHVTEFWKKALRPKPDGSNDLGADEQDRSAELPTPRILHPWSDERFAVKHPRWEPSA